MPVTSNLKYQPPFTPHLSPPPRTLRLFLTPPFVSVKHQSIKGSVIRRKQPLTTKMLLLFSPCCRLQTREWLVSMSSSSSSELYLTEYERERQKKIEENKRVLETLGILESRSVLDATASVCISFFLLLYLFFFLCVFSLLVVLFSFFIIPCLRK